MKDPNLQEAGHWLEYAKQDLEAAEKMFNEGGFVYRHICFLAQQAAEKALKAIFVYLQVDYPWKHDLDALRNLLPDDWPVKRQYPDLARLTEWAVEARYPGDWQEASVQDAKIACMEARGVIDSVTQEFIKRGIEV
jgi:HEPN domain-containing protein